MTLEDMVQVRLETLIPPQKIMQQVILYQEQIGLQVEAGVKAAIEGFDFEKAVTAQTNEIIERTIRDAISRGQLKEMIQKKVNQIADSIADKYWQEFLK